MKFMLNIAFDGRAFRGWSPPGGRGGVKAQLLQAFEALNLPCAECVAASRTDAGVHARALSTHVVVPDNALEWSAERLLVALNARLPEEIRLQSAQRVPEAFHARFDATSKQYRYVLWNHPAMSPLWRHCAWHVPTPLQLDAMRHAAHTLTGTHDFRAFTSRRNGELGDSCRTLTRFHIRRSGPAITCILEGSGFLYKMCRALVGTVVAVGQGKLPLESLPGLIASKDRSTTGPNAPAHGLTLWKVNYPTAALKSPPVSDG